MAKKRGYDYGKNSSPYCKNFSLTGTTPIGQLRRAGIGVNPADQVKSLAFAALGDDWAAIPGRKIMHVGMGVGAVAAYVTAAGTPCDDAAALAALEALRAQGKAALTPAGWRLTRAPRA